jgi:hypothetical protein
MTHPLFFYYWVVTFLAVISVLALAAWLHEWWKYHREKQNGGL